MNKFICLCLFILLLCCQFLQAQSKESLIADYNTLLENMENYLLPGYISQYNKGHFSRGIVEDIGKIIITDYEYDLTVQQVGNLFIRVQHIADGYYRYILCDRFYKQGNFLVTNDGLFVLASEIIENNTDTLTMVLYTMTKKSAIQRTGKYFVLTNVTKKQGIVNKKTLMMPYINLTDTLMGLRVCLEKINTLDAVKGYAIKKELILHLMDYVMHAELSRINKANILSGEDISGYERYVQEREYYYNMDDLLYYLKLDNPAGSVSGQ